MTNTIKSTVMDAQRRWALAAGHQPDKQGYLENVDDNLFKPLSERALEGLGQGSGSELIDKDHEKAKFKALHSSSALAVNVFDYFMENDRSPIKKALGFDSPIISVKFEEKFPTGLRGTPPNLDVVLRLEDGMVIAIESKFTEWMDAVSGTAKFRDSYFPVGKALWEEQGLAQSQRLAEAMREGEVSFVYLNAMQLLKHALGLANQLGRKFRLIYLFFDWPGDESKRHWAEINWFASQTGQELGFHAMSYQELFHCLAAYGDFDVHYLDYLGRRYFPEQTPVNADNTG